MKKLQVVLNTILKSMRALSSIITLIALFVFIFALIGRGLFSESKVEVI